MSGSYLKNRVFAVLLRLEFPYKCHCFWDRSCIIACRTTLEWTVSEPSGHHGKPFNLISKTSFSYDHFWIPLGHDLLMAFFKSWWRSTGAFSTIKLSDQLRPTTRKGWDEKFVTSGIFLKNHVLRSFVWVKSLEIWRCHPFRCSLCRILSAICLQCTASVNDEVSKGHPFSLNL